MNTALILPPEGFGGPFDTTTTGFFEPSFIFATGSSEDSLGGQKAKQLKLDPSACRSPIPGE